MKKILALGATALCALGASSAVFATEITAPGQQSIEAEYTINSEFSVTIPTGIIFTDADTSVVETVSVENVFIDAGSSLVVSMKSANGNLINGTDSYIPYSFTIGSATTQIAKATDYELLSIASSDGTSDSVDVTFTAGDLDHAVVSGRHADTLTFTVAIDGETGGGTEEPEEPETPPIASGLILSIDDWAAGITYPTGTNAGAYSTNARTTKDFITPQKVRVELTDPGKESELTSYYVIYVAYGADGTPLNASNGAFHSYKVTMTDGVAVLDLPTLYPSAAKFKLDILRFDGSFLNFSTTADINVYAVED